MMRRWWAGWWLVLALTGALFGLPTPPLACATPATGPPPVEQPEARPPPGLAPAVPSPRLSDTALREAERAHAALKIYDRNGHPWRVAREDWDGARRRVSTDPAWAVWLARERRSVDEWIAVPRDRADWKPGWWHDFVSPKDGSHLTWTPEIPGEQVAFLHSPSDPHVDVTPKRLAAWVAELRGRNAGMMRRAALLYRLTAAPGYGEWAAAQLDFYADHYLSFEPQRPDQQARLYWQSLDEAVNGIVYADTARLLEPLADAGRRQRWWDGLFAPMARMLAVGYPRIHNIALWHRCAEARIALAFGDEAMWRKALDGPYGVHAQIARGITADGLWFEQSFHYNEYVVSAAATLFTAAGIHGRADSLALDVARVENLLLAPIALRFPNGMLPNPADGTGIETAPHEAFLARVSRIYPTAIGLTAVANRKDWDTLLDPPGASPPPAPLPKVMSMNLEASGMALLRKGPWQVFLHVGQLDRSHAQSEALNFSASCGADDITHDPGTVGYGSPLHRDYYREGLNHNVPLVEGLGEKQPQRGRLVAFDGQAGVMTAEQPAYQPGVSASRTLRIDGERLVDEVTVSCADGRTRALGLVLHLQGRIETGEGWAPAPDFARERPPAFGYWTGATTKELSDSARFVVECGRTRLHVTVRVPGRFRVWHASTPDVPPGRREGLYVETQGARATFVTTLEPGPR